MKTINIKYLIAIFTLLIFGIFFAILNWKNNSAPYARFESPNGKFFVIVEKNKTHLPSIMMPGQGSDSPGTAMLANKKGEILDKKDVEMLQLINNIEWHPNRATIMLGVDLFYSREK